MIDSGEEKWAWPESPGVQCLHRPEELTIQAQPGSDLIRIPGVREIDRVCAYQRPISGDFTVTVSVSVQGERFADAAGIVVRDGDGGWLKAAVERTRSLEWAVFTIVSLPNSDEACGAVLPAAQADLLVTRERTRFAVLHKNADQQDWIFARTFRWAAPETISLGLFAQAPFSDGSFARFEHLNVSAQPMRDRR